MAIASDIAALGGFGFAGNLWKKRQLKRKPSILYLQQRYEKLAGAGQRSRCFEQVA